MALYSLPEKLQQPCGRTFAGVEGGQLHAGFRANVTYTATSVIHVWMQCLVGVVFLRTSCIKLSQFVL